MLSFQSAYTKAQNLAGDNTAPTLVQLKQDINVGYHRFNAAISRYFTRKQQFSNIVANQQYYQTPVDMVKPTLVSVTIPNGFQYPLYQVRSEEEWRLKNIVANTSNMTESYFVYGNDQIGLFPIPSTDVSAGLRLVYQPQDVDMTKDDYTTGTASITNGAVSVTGTGTSWDATHVGMSFQTNNNTDGNWYEIIAVPNSTTLTLKTPYVGPTATDSAYTLGQMFIVPGEYSDTPINYALSRFFEGKNNDRSAVYYTNKFQADVNDAIEKYASSSTSNVITDEDDYLNAWYLPVQPGT